MVTALAASLAVALLVIGFLYWLYIGEKAYRKYWHREYLRVRDNERRLLDKLAAAVKAKRRGGLFG